MWRTVWKALRGEYGGRILGVIFGIFCGFLYLFSGFWDMLIFAFIVYAGYHFGYNIDNGHVPFDLRPVRNWLTQRWKGFK